MCIGLRQMLCGVHTFPLNTLVCGNAFFALHFTCCYASKRCAFCVANEVGIAGGRREWVTPFSHLVCHSKLWCFHYRSIALFWNSTLSGLQCEPTSRRNSLNFNISIFLEQRRIENVSFRLFNFWKMERQKRFLTMLWHHTSFQKMETIQKLVNLVKFLIFQ